MGWRVLTTLLFVAGFFQYSVRADDDVESCLLKSDSTTQEGTTQYEDVNVTFIPSWDFWPEDELLTVEVSVRHWHSYCVPVLVSTEKLVGSPSNDATTFKCCCENYNVFHVFRKLLADDFQSIRVSAYAVSKKNGPLFEEIYMGSKTHYQKLLNQEIYSNDQMVPEKSSQPEASLEEQGILVESVPFKKVKLLSRVKREYTSSPPREPHYENRLRTNCPSLSNSCPHCTNDVTHVLQNICSYPVVLRAVVLSDTTTDGYGRICGKLGITKVHGSIGEKSFRRLVYFSVQNTCPCDFLVRPSQHVYILSTTSPWQQARGYYAKISLSDQVFILPDDRYIETEIQKALSYCSPSHQGPPMQTTPPGGYGAPAPERVYRPPPITPAPQLYPPPPITSAPQPYPPPHMTPAPQPYPPPHTTPAPQPYPPPHTTPAPQPYPPPHMTPAPQPYPPPHMTPAPQPYPPPHMTPAPQPYPPPQPRYGSTPSPSYPTPPSYQTTQAATYPPTPVYHVPTHPPSPVPMYGPAIPPLPPAPLPTAPPNTVESCLHGDTSCPSCPSLSSGSLNQDYCHSDYAYLIRLNLDEVSATLRYGDGYGPPSCVKRHAKFLYEVTKNREPQKLNMDTSIFFPGSCRCSATTKGTQIVLLLSYYGPRLSGSAVQLTQSYKMYVLPSYGEILLPSCKEKISYDPVSPDFPVPSQPSLPSSNCPPGTEDSCPTCASQLDANLHGLFCSSKFAVVGQVHSLGSSYGSELTSVTVTTIYDYHGIRIKIRIQTTVKQCNSGTILITEDLKNRPAYGATYSPTRFPFIVLTKCQCSVLSTGQKLLLFSMHPLSKLHDGSVQLTSKFYVVFLSQGHNLPSCQLGPYVVPQPTAYPTQVPYPPPVQYTTPPPYNPPSTQYKTPAPYPSTKQYTTPATYRPPTQYTTPATYRPPTQYTTPQYRPPTQYTTPSYRPPAQYSTPAAYPSPTQDTTPPYRPPTQYATPPYQPPTQYATPAPYPSPTQYTTPVPYPSPIQYTSPPYRPPAQYTTPAPYPSPTQYTTPLYRPPAQYTTPAPYHPPPTQYTTPQPYHPPPTQYTTPPLYHQPPTQYSTLPPYHLPPTQYTTSPPYHPPPTQYTAPPYQPPTQYTTPAPYQPPTQYTTPAPYHPSPTQYTSPPPYQPSPPYQPISPPRPAPVYDTQPSRQPPSSTFPHGACLHRDTSCPVCTNEMPQNFHNYFCTSEFAMLFAMGLNYSAVVTGSQEKPPALPFKYPEKTDVNVHQKPLALPFKYPEKTDLNVHPSRTEKAELVIEVTATQTTQVKAQPVVPDGSCYVERIRALHDVTKYSNPYEKVVDLDCYVPSHCKCGVFNLGPGYGIVLSKERPNLHQPVVPLQLNNQFAYFPLPHGEFSLPDCSAPPSPPETIGRRETVASYGPERDFIPPQVSSDCPGGTGRSCPRCYQGFPPHLIQQFCEMEFAIIAQIVERPSAPPRDGPTLSITKTTTASLRARFSVIVQTVTPQQPTADPYRRMKREIYLSCPHGMVVSSCAPHPDCEVTCQNYKNRYNLVCPLHCTAGCVCPEGLVKHGTTCVKPSDCPGGNRCRRVLMKVKQDLRPQYGHTSVSGKLKAFFLDHCKCHFTDVSTGFAVLLSKKRPVITTTDGLQLSEKIHIICLQYGSTPLPQCSAPTSYPPQPTAAYPMPPKTTEYQTIEYTTATPYHLTTVSPHSSLSFIPVTHMPAHSVLEKCVHHSRSSGCPICHVMNSNVQVDYCNSQFGFVMTVMGSQYVDSQYTCAAGTLTSLYTLHPNEPSRKGVGLVTYTISKHCNCPSLSTSHQFIVVLVKKSHSARSTAQHLEFSSGIEVYAVQQDITLPPCGRTVQYSFRSGDLPEEEILPSVDNELQEMNALEYSSAVCPVEFSAISSCPKCLAISSYDELSQFVCSSEEALLVSSAGESTRTPVPKPFSHRIQLAQPTSAGNYSVKISLDETNYTEICQLPVDRGSCNSLVTHFYYDSEKNKCEGFEYSGCLGNANNFESLESCETSCIKKNYCQKGKLTVEKDIIGGLIEQHSEFHYSIFHHCNCSYFEKPGGLAVIAYNFSDFQNNTLQLTENISVISLKEKPKSFDFSCGKISPTTERITFQTESSMVADFEDEGDDDGFWSWGK